MTPAQWRQLAAALLAFERLPGRYAVALREPLPLFVHSGSVLRLAAGRPAAGMPAAWPDERALRRAARYFVRTVMLRPGADPFTLLGLRPGFEPAQLREHHRLMIRLTHPDLAVAAEAWPADAASRVNLARDRLSAARAPRAAAAA